MPGHIRSCLKMKEVMMGAKDLRGLRKKRAKHGKGFQEIVLHPFPKTLDAGQGEEGVNMVAIDGKPEIDEDDPVRTDQGIRGPDIGVGNPTLMELAHHESHGSKGLDHVPGGPFFKKLSERPARDILHREVILPDLDQARDEGEVLYFKKNPDLVREASGSEIRPVRPFLGSLVLGDLDDDFLSVEQGPVNDAEPAAADLF